MVSLAVTVIDSQRVFFAVALLALGAILLIGGYFGLISFGDGTVGPSSLSEATVRVLCAAVAAAAMFAVTGWPVPTLFAALGGWFFLTMKNAKRRRRESIDRVDAIASWVESVRDNISGSAGLQQALRMSADHAPGPIRGEVRDLVLRLQHESVTVALRRFAADLAHPTADMAVGCLILASSRSAGSLASVLAKTAQAARDSASMMRHVDAGRVATQSQAKIVSLIAGCGALFLIISQREFVAPFASTNGQIALFVICTMVSISAFAIYQLSKPVHPTRVFKGVEADPELLAAKANA